MKRGLVVAGVLLALLLPTAPGAATRSQPERVGRPFVRTVLTPDEAHYRYRTGDGKVRIRSTRARRGADHNRREVFHRAGVAATRDQASCATWQSQSGGMVQQGLAVRIRTDGRRHRGVTLTKNTIFGVHWVFNLLTWDSRRRGLPWRAAGQFDMSAAVGESRHRLYPLPWRVCLRVTGRRVAFKVWPLGVVAVPAWDDPTYSRSTRLPRAFVIHGRPGWYVGHLPGRGRVVYRNLMTSS